jgi:two-component system, OmpR family, phosphate regulon sensor histidine kinase PhoR
MKNYFRTTQWVAALTACCIFTFQAVWVYRSYRTSEENFKIKVTQALKRSVDQYLLEHIPTPISLSGSAPMLYVVNKISREGDKEISSSLKAPFDTANSVRIDFQPLPIDTANLETVRLFVAQMTALSNKKKIDMAIVAKYFRKELAKENITINFKLSLMKPTSDKSEGVINVPLGSGKGDQVISAMPEGVGRHLLNENLAPALVSLFLILLTAGCLWYMRIIILRQRVQDQKKNDFIDNLAHELRTPVSILKSTNEALLHFGQATDAEKTNRYLQFNAGVLDKLENGIDRLLRIRQYELGGKSSSITHVNLSELINEVTNLFKPGPKDKITTAISKIREAVYSDRDMLKDILTNLIDNALKYSDGPAIIEVEVTGLNRGWQLSVKDNGIGISEENLPLIFDKFYRVATGDVHDVKGYGIGLSYVKQLVLQLGGNITVTSEVGVGTTFIIFFSK